MNRQNVQVLLPVTSHMHTEFFDSCKYEFTINFGTFLQGYYNDAVCYEKYSVSGW